MRTQFLLRLLPLRCLAICMICLGALPNASTAQTDRPSPQTNHTIAATVNEYTITTNQIERELARTLNKIKLNDQQLKRARDATLEKLIDQRVVFEFLKKHDVAAGQQEVHLQLAELETELARVEKSIDDYLRQTDQTLEELQFTTAWQFSWQSYLDRKLTDESLESHFDKNRRQFDGTELRVAHLLLKLPKNATAKQVGEMKERADKITAEIASTSLSFEQAVAEHSDAPTKNSGGEIGWIGVNGPMPGNFSRAAFELSFGEISKPVATKFGIHLILCMEVKQGKLGWRDTIDAVKKSAAQEYFHTIANKHRPEVKIVYPELNDD